MNIQKKLPPPAPLIASKTKEVYTLWHKNLDNLKKSDRMTLGYQIDNYFLYLLENIFKALFTNNKLEKLSLVSNAITKNDLIKFFLQLAWEQKMINREYYTSLILLLDEIGRMLGGWKKSIQEKTLTK